MTVQTGLRSGGPVPEVETSGVPQAAEPAVDRGLVEDATEVLQPQVQPDPGPGANTENLPPVYSANNAPAQLETQNPGCPAANAPAQLETRNPDLPTSQPDQPIMQMPVALIPTESQAV